MSSKGDRERDAELLRRLREQQRDAREQARIDRLRAEDQEAQAIHQWGERLSREYHKTHSRSETNALMGEIMRLRKQGKHRQADRLMRDHYREVMAVNARMINGPKDKKKGCLSVIVAVVAGLVPVIAAAAGVLRDWS